MRLLDALLPPGTAAEVAPAPPRRGAANHGVPVAIVVAGVGLALVLAALAYVMVSDRSSGASAASATPSTYGVVIPKGTGKRIASGFHLFLIPADLQLHVGDSLVVVNEDTQVHEVGPFSVRPGETMVHTFVEPGRFVGACTFHPAGEVAIEVFPVDVPITPPSLPPNVYR